MRGTQLWVDFVDDARHAVRWLLSDPAFAILAITLISLGIGATGAVYTVLRSVVIAPLPYPESDRLVSIVEVSQRGLATRVSWPNYADMRREVRSLSAIVSVAGPEQMSVVVDGHGLVSVGSRVSQGFLEVLAVPLLEGRDFLPHEQEQGGELAVIASVAFRDRWVPLSSAIPGARIQVNGHDATIVGVIATESAYPAGTHLWVNLEVAPDSTHGNRTAHNFEVLGRAAPEVLISQVQAELDGLVNGIRGRDLSYTAMGMQVRSLRDHVVGDAAQPVIILMGGSLLLLLIACSNLSGMMVSRSVAQQKEIAIRIACGAGRNRLVRRALTEALLLSSLGAGVGVWVGHFFVGAAVAAGPAALPRLDQVHIDNGVLAFTTVVAVITALVSGALPAIKASRVQPRDSLIGLRRISATGDRVGGLPAIVGLQACVSLILLAASGMMVLSVWKLLNEDAGIEIDNRVVLTLALPESRYDAAQRTAFLSELLRRLDADPVVQFAGLTLRPPLSGWEPEGSVFVGDIAAGQAAYRVASPGLLEALGMTMLRGRWLVCDDQGGAEPVAVINESFARSFFPGQDPIGAQFRTGGMDDLGGVPVTIVGIVNDVRHKRLDRTAEPAYYLNYAQRPHRTGNIGLVAWIRGEVDQAGTHVGSIVREIDPALPFAAAPLGAGREASLAPRRFVLLILSAFATLALVMTAAGIYGLVAFSVAARGREISIRVALGASRWAVVRTVAGSIMAFVCAGVAVGATGVWLIGRLLTPMLYKVEPFDPVIVTAGMLMIAIAAVAATAIPVTRAATLDPAESLRDMD